ncbi:unnamed protein product [Vicia faba]|uniref:BED-type domain-containing protein n=1 Tax=Vicia faba TaxID=3906 RepID=A0AAV0YMS0_VICFA|nr:unnamed protein product [Vicia faba]
MNIDKEVNYVAGSNASFSMAENQSQNSPPTPTTNQPQTIDLDKQEGDNVQQKKKRKVGEADESKDDDSNAGDSGKLKPCKPKSWVWDHFTRDESGTRAKCNWSTKSYATDSHKNGTSNLNNHLMHQCKKIPKHVLDPSQTTLSLQGGSKGNINALFGIQFDIELCIQALARMIIVDELPFSFVENEGFRHFMSVTQPRFPLPRRISIARDCLSLYVSEKHKLRSMFTKTNQSVCLTTDAWTSM